ncbi:hypothetical protein R3P38DRAFT_2843889 [Favolaschia claudopus]|uniref:Secreted protein n=1 Tax=Favolaschia claudopus TaxID=2862362 RepID=A0AAW0DZJ2_9AGAR
MGSCASKRRFLAPLNLSWLAPSLGQLQFNASRNESTHSGSTNPRFELKISVQYKITSNHTLTSTLKRFVDSRDSSRL